ncbi:PAS domain-containing sensor histidine kinase [Fundidesulfovibrio agrisoli]|uniref:PAS domain-containing sensor histidine kinase n=1 Tax=Fundidesulfovibrio agrisoli TaxID=2922717 RepID=UPI001FAE4721|nr:PAS domain S-box protein [Fundidesulfovibrio agrisoli]
MPRLKPLGIISVYAIASALWIFFSDKAAATLFTDSPDVLRWVSTLKGWFYVVVIAGMLWLLLRRFEKQHSVQAAALAESESRYRSVIENIPDVYYRTDAAGNLIMLSPSVLPLLRYDSLDQLLGRSNAGFWEHPEQREAFMELINRQGEVRDYEVSLLRSDGIPVVVSTSSKLFRDCTGAVAGIEGIFRDISTRKQAERSLNDSAARLRRAELVAGTGNWEIDLTTRIVTSSEGARKIYGMTTGEMTLEAVQSLPLPEYRTMLDNAMLALVSNGEPYNVEFKIQRPEDGAILDIHSMANYDPASRMVFGIIQDITARKHIEDSLREALAFNESIFTYSPVAIGVFDGYTGRCVRANPVLAGITSLDIEALGKRGFRDVESWLTSGLEDLAERVLADGISRRSEVNLKGDGRELRLDCTLARMEAKEAGFLLLIAADITERRRMQEMMVQTEKMISVAGLAAGMAHEINNPLSGILQNVQVMRRRLTQESEVNAEAAREAGCSFESIARFMELRGILDSLDNVRDAGFRAAHVVTGMLDFSRRSESDNAPADLAALLDKTVALCSTDYDLKKKFDFRNIRIIREYEPDLPEVPCSKTQIQQVVMNLLTNAAHSLMGRSLPTITLRTAHEGEVARIDIEDNGAGMDEATRRKVFEPFFTTKPVGEGTGLGLSVSYFIITSNHGGSLDVASTPGKGSCFTIRLPYRAGSVSAARRNARLHA